ncbi:MAG: 2-oxoacid:acceptor oxidoreductase family protein [Nitrospirota bacterium]
METKLTEKNKAGFYEIRMESIGGLGANLAGKMLAEAGILKQGLNGSAFSSYGSEKKGSPIRTFVRFCDPETEVRINSPIEEPHLLVIFHENLIKSLPVTEGVNDDSIVIVNTKKKPQEMRDILKLHAGRVGTVDALGIAIDEKVKLNTTMLGAITKASGFLDMEMVKDAIKDTLGKRYAHLLDANLRAFDRGYNELLIEEFSPDDRYSYIPFKRQTPQLGYKNAPIGGVIVNPGNTIAKDLSSSRSGFIPVFDKDKCINCGECDTTCPDFCFVWEKGLDKRGKPSQVLTKIDYRYCKGCMRCVEICKTAALTPQKEV